MDTIALRFSDKFSPPDGTIAVHRRIIEEKGFVWYGKMGQKVSEKTKKMILDNQEPKILLIHSGTNKRYWAHVCDISWDVNYKENIPAYYRDDNNFKRWFKVIDIVDAPEGIMGACRVKSSKSILSNASKGSMSPIFVIEYGWEEEE